MGSYEYQNNLLQSNTIAGNFSAILGNSSAPQNGIFVNDNNVFGAADTAQTGINSTTSIGSSSVFNSVSLVINFIIYLPNAYNALVHFMAVPFVALGVSPTFAITVINVLFVGILALGVISAIFLFPI